MLAIILHGIKETELSIHFIYSLRIIDFGQVLENSSPHNNKRYCGSQKITKETIMDEHLCTVYSVQLKHCGHKHYLAAIAQRRLTLYLWFCIKSSENNGRWKANGKCVHVVCDVALFCVVPTKIVYSFLNLSKWHFEWWTDGT